MSVTTTDNPLSANVLGVLQDYELHHSSSPNATPAELNPRRDTAAAVSNPPNWPTDHRRVPPYRPADQDLDMEQRPGGLNLPEMVFIFTMLHGVMVNATVNTAWRATLGRLKEKWWRYDVGGEW